MTAEVRALAAAMVLALLMLIIWAVTQWGRGAAASAPALPVTE